MNYRKIYRDLIDRALLKGIGDDIIYEVHHIFPKSLGGLDEENNLVYLTLKEHFISHLPMTLFRKSYMENIVIEEKQNNTLASKYKGRRAIRC